MTNLSGWMVVVFVFLISGLQISVLGQSCNGSMNIRVNTSLQSLTLHDGLIGISNCSWVLDSGTDSLQILLVIKSNFSCGVGSATVYDGPNGTYPLIDTFCGVTPSSRLISSSRRYVHLSLQWTLPDVAILSADVIATTDHSGKGCGGKETITINDELDHFLSTPGFPETYPSSSKCRWLLHNPSGLIQIDIVFSDVEDDSTLQCDYDKYSIHDGEYKCENNLVLTACTEFSKTTPLSHTSNGSAVTVTFESDSSINNRGFLIKYAGINNLEKSESQDGCSSHTRESLETPVLVGVVLGSVTLLCFTTLTVVLLIVKSRPSSKKSVEPLDDMLPRKRDCRDTVRERKSDVLCNKKYKQSEQ